MPYTFLHSNGQPLATVPDQTIDKSTLGGLSLIGRGAVNYGQEITENFIVLLENFSSPHPPVKAVVGQLWYDTSTESLKLWDGRRWTVIGNSDGTPFNLPHTLVRRDATGNFAASTITANLNGSATSALAWTFPRALAITGDAQGVGVIDGSRDVVLTLSVTTAGRADVADRATLADRTLQADHAGSSDRAALADRALSADRTETAGTAQRLSTPRTIALAQDATGSATFDGSADATIGVTLRTVNPNVGTFNTLTVNAKGLVTAASNVDLTKIKVDNALHADKADLATRATNADRAALADRTPLADRAGRADAAGEADQAKKLTTPRTIAITGKVNGQAAFDGASNITIAVTGTDSAVADATTASMVGQGQGAVFFDKNGTDLRFRMLRAGRNVTIAEDGGSIVISAADATNTTTPGQTVTISPRHAAFNAAEPVGVTLTGAAGAPDQREVLIRQWRFQTDAKSMMLIATMEGFYGMNNQFTTASYCIGRVDLYVDGTLVRSASNGQRRDGAPNHSAPHALLHYSGSTGGGDVAVNFVAQIDSPQSGITVNYRNCVGSFVGFP